MYTDDLKTVYHFKISELYIYAVLINCYVEKISQFSIKWPHDLSPEKYVYIPISKFHLLNKMENHDLKKAVHDLSMMRLTHANRRKNVYE